MHRLAGLLRLKLLLLPVFALIIFLIQLPLAALIGNMHANKAFGISALADDDDDDDDDRPRWRPVHPRLERVQRPRRERASRARPELVISGLSDAQITSLRRNGFDIVAERRLTVLPGATVRAAIPRRMSERRARARSGDRRAGDRGPQRAVSSELQGSIG